MQISKEILQAAHLKWNEYLVGYYIGKRFPLKLMESALKNAWGHHLAEVLADDLDFYFFCIPDADFRWKVLDEGSLIVAKVPLILQQWHLMID